MIQTPEDFYAWERASRDIIDVKRCYVDIAGDLATGVLLSQIIYWYLPDRHGHSKVGVERDDRIWLVKSRADWWEECRLTPRQIDRSVKSLKSKGLIETGRFRFKGLTPLHIWLNLEAVIEALNHHLVKAESPSGKSGITTRGIRSHETVNPLPTKTTTKTTKGPEKPARSRAAPDSPISEVFDAVLKHLGNPEIDPIPNHGKEATFIKRMLTRGYSVDQIVAFWKKKSAARGGVYVSMVYVNEDIGKEGQQGALLPTEDELAREAESKGLT